MANQFVKISMFLAMMSVAVISCGGDEEKVINVGNVTITLNPAKTTLVVGETIDVTISVTPSDAANKTVTLASDNAAVSVTPKTNGWTLKAESKGAAKITATAQDGGGASAFINVTVNEPVTLASIAVTKQPDKLTYTVGETFDRAGMEVTATYSDQTTAKVDNDDLDIVCDLTAAGMKTVIVKYQGKEDATSVKITVVEVVVPIITINTQPAATTNVTVGSISGSLSVAATVTEGATLSYQWYSNTSASNEGGTSLGNSATGASFTIPATLPAGEYYYFCVVNATGGADPKRSNVATVTVAAVAAGPFCGGTGAETDPYLICTAQQLAQLATFVNANNANYNDKYYELTADIDLNVAPYNEGAGWMPIGANNSFRGTFDGNNHKISGLYINNSVLDGAGLFGGFIGKSVQNLGVEGIVSGRDGVGGVIGNMSASSRIINCYSNVTVSGRDNVGGLVGNNNKSSVTKCYATGSVSGRMAVGGVVGWIANEGSIDNCYATGSVSGTNSGVGGVVGSAIGYVFDNLINITNCYATGTISGVEFVGGVIGSTSYSNVNNCAALNSRIIRAEGNVSTLGNERDFERVSSSSGTGFSGNVAWDDMTLPSGELRGNHGEDITTAAIKADGTLGGRFTTANGWTVENGKLPGFGAAVEMPEHLK